MWQILAGAERLRSHLGCHHLVTGTHVHKVPLDFCAREIFPFSLEKRLEERRNRNARYLQRTGTEAGGKKKKELCMNAHGLLEKSRPLRTNIAALMFDHQGNGDSVLA